MIPAVISPSVVAFLGQLSIESVTARQIVLGLTLLSVFLVFHHMRRALHQLRLAADAGRPQQYRPASNAVEPVTAQQRQKDKKGWLS